MFVNKLDYEGADPWLFDTSDRLFSQQAPVARAFSVHHFFMSLSDECRSFCSSQQTLSRDPEHPDLLITPDMPMWQTFSTLCSVSLSFLPTQCMNILSQVSTYEAWDTVDRILNPRDIKKLSTAPGWMEPLQSCPNGANCHFRFDSLAIYSPHCASDESLPALGKVKLSRIGVVTLGCCQQCTEVARQDAQSASSQQQLLVSRQRSVKTFLLGN